MSSTLGKLIKVDLRHFWKHEALDFTKWLAQKENLELLSDEIGIDISLIQDEANVGSFQVDILAEEENTGKKIVIENQLETTNHDHLGKIITYASGFDAEVLIWIVKESREEHKQAIDWLNEHTDEQVNIFLIKMELWQIGESPYAPKFHIISEPNDWAKAVKKSANQAALSETKLMQLEFWTQFKEYAQKNDLNLRLRKPQPHHWFDISIGNSKSHITLIVDTQNEQLRSELYIPDSMDLYSELEKFRDEIDQEIECNLEWEPMEGRKASKIFTLTNIEVTNEEVWKECFSWLAKNVKQFYEVFTSYIEKINIR